MAYKFSTLMSTCGSTPFLFSSDCLQAPVLPLTSWEQVGLFSTVVYEVLFSLIDTSRKLTTKHWPQETKKMVSEGHLQLSSSEVSLFL